MPDHMHGILILDRNSRSDVSPKHRDNSPKHRDNSPKHRDNSQKHPNKSPQHPNKSTQYPDTSNDVSFDSSFDIQINHPIEKNQSPYFSSISPKSGSIPVAIRSFKSVVSKHAHKLNKDFQWQKLYHDRIIRDFEEFIRIKYYIQNNPKNWLKKNKSNGS
jgi:hypothetical protein